MTYNYLFFLQILDDDYVTTVVSRCWSPCSDWSIPLSDSASSPVAAQQRVVTVRLPMSAAVRVVTVSCPVLGSAFLWHLAQYTSPTNAIRHL